MLFLLLCRFEQVFFYDLVIEIEYLASEFIVESPSPSVGSSPRTKISFFLPSACTNELFSTQIIIPYYLLLWIVDISLTFLTRSLLVLWIKLCGHPVLF